MHPKLSVNSMYVRFVVPDIDEDSEQELGIFRAIDRLRKDGKLLPYEEEHVAALRRWFDAHLGEPTRFTTSKPPYHRKNKKAICWFKDSAQEHISRAREMVAILENHGIVVEMLKTEQVGYIAYEDEFQIAAEPFSDRP